MFFVFHFFLDYKGYSASNPALSLSLPRGSPLTSKIVWRSLDRVKSISALSTHTVNPFPSKGFPIDEYNRLALDRVKSVSGPSAHLAVKGLSAMHVNSPKTLGAPLSEGKTTRSRCRLNIQTFDSIFRYLCSET